MDTSEIVFTAITSVTTVGSLVVAIMALRNSRLQSKTRKYEMQRSYYCEVLEWYSQTTNILCNLKHLLNYNPEIFKKERSRLLAQLSSQIDIGRFYFPNKEDNFGSEKPLAYKGLRNIVLDYLVFSYQLYNRTNIDEIPIKYLDQFQREYTSEIFEILKPKDHIDHLYTLTDKSYYKNWTIEDVLRKDPEFISRIITED